MRVCVHKMQVYLCMHIEKKYLGPMYLYQWTGYVTLRIC